MSSDYQAVFIIHQSSAPPYQNPSYTSEAGWGIVISILDKDQRLDRVEGLTINRHSLKY